MTIIPDANLIFSDVVEMLAYYTPAFLTFLVIGLPARWVFKIFHNALEHKTRF